MEIGHCILCKINLQGCKMLTGVRKKKKKYWHKIVIVKRRILVSFVRIYFYKYMNSNGNSNKNSMFLSIAVRIIESVLTVFVKTLNFTFNALIW